MVKKNENPGIIRKATLSDARMIAEIYNYYVTRTDISFETEKVSETEMRRRIEDISQHHPFLVHVTDGVVDGYCYAHPWKERLAYSHTLETTVYVDSSAHGRGIGEKLTRELMARCQELGSHSLIACITGSNQPSIRLHEKLGFKKVSHFKEVGFKFGRWLDVVDYELIL